VVPGSVSPYAHLPAMTEPTLEPNVAIPATATLPAFLAAGAAEAASSARGQLIIDAAKDIGRLDTSRNPYGGDAWPLVTPRKK
jgi:hypothetical protein